MTISGPKRYIADELPSQRESLFTGGRNALVVKDSIHKDFMNGDNSVQLESISN
jgi:hypothetical protein